MWPSMQRLQWLIYNYNGSLETFIWSGRYSRFSDTKTGLFLWVSPLPHMNKKCASNFGRETENENEQFKHLCSLYIRLRVPLTIIHVPLTVINVRLTIRCPFTIKNDFK